MTSAKVADRYLRYSASGPATPSTLSTPPTCCRPRPGRSSPPSRDPSRTRQSLLTLAAFRPWGSLQVSATRGVGVDLGGPRRRASRGRSSTGFVGRYPPRRRIRLVAYGARLESGLGATPSRVRIPHPPLLAHSPVAAAPISRSPAAASVASRAFGIRLSAPGRPNCLAGTTSAREATLVRAARAHGLRYWDRPRRPRAAGRRSA